MNSSSTILSRANGRPNCGLSKKFDVLMVPEDYQILIQLSARYGISMGALIRLALKDLYRKLDIEERKAHGESLNPILTDAPQAPPADMDGFWKTFRT